MKRKRKGRMIPDHKLIGRRLNDLKIERLVIRKIGKQSVRWATCSCSCGRENIEFRLSNITRQFRPTKSCGCRRKLPFGVGAMRRVCATYRKNAVVRNIDFSLTDQQMQGLFESSCFYCGLPPQNVQNVPGGNGAYTYSGIDRIDNKVGYTANNCVPCCRDCNFAKRGFTQEKFLELACRIADNQKKKQEKK